VDDIAKGNALIRFFHQVDPATLDDEQWAERLNEITWCLKVVQKLIWGSDKKS